MTANTSQLSELENILENKRLPDTNQPFKRKRSILGLLPLFKVLEEQGRSPQSILAARGLSLDNLTGAAMIDTNLELDIVGDAIELLNDPILGVKVGSQVSFTSYGTYAMLLMTADTFLESARVAAQFQHLSLLFSHMTLHFDSQGLEVRYTVPDAPRKLRDFIADRDLMGTYIFMREFLAEAPHVLVGGTVRSKPERHHLATYKKYLNFDVSFDQPYNWFRIPASMLRLSQQHSNVWAHKLYKAQAYELLNTFYPAQQNLVTQVKTLIAGYQSGYPSACELAKIMGMSERTLRRKLDAAGASYRNIIDAQQQKRAIDMLSSQRLSIATIASQLGYAEPASFLRAFKRWTGLTPKRFLQQPNTP
ncbi:helix-turn-helix domain-containing protein [Alteromonas sp. P256]|uniref:helix-turn-helix domain-containing protein n=1 Tax=Alteromonas sp. P256 TaxID=3117399 RepID=UPI002FE09E67